LIERGWRVAFIEGDPKRFSALKRNFEKTHNVRTIEAWVTPAGESSLDDILARAGIEEIDFLSVDIDGDDYHVIAAMKAIPKVICVEFNPTMPPPLEIVSRLGMSEGTSLAAFESLARQKGYALIHATKWNAFLVRGDLTDRFVTKSAADAFNPRHARFAIAFFNGGCRIVDARGNPARLKNPWSRSTLISVNVPRPTRIAAVLAAVFFVVAVAYIWIA
jgi:hypothetical protein